MTQAKNTINNRVIRTEKDLAAYRDERHAYHLAKNPDRDFFVLFGGDPTGQFEEVVIWLDGKGKMDL